MAKKDKIQQAQDAYASKDINQTRHVHRQGHEPHSNESGQYLKSIVFGGLDGIITTFAVVAGVAGANIGTSVILIMGFANLVADGLSMAIGDYLSSKSEQEYNALERKREMWEMEHIPEGEILEMQELYESKGMAAEDAEKVVTTMAKYKEMFVDIMMVEELGIIEDTASPVKSAVATFFSFAFFGFVPLLAAVLSGFIPLFAQHLFVISAIFTAITLFALGAAKSKVSGVNWLKSGLEMLLVGGLAAAAAYLVGVLLGGV